MQAPSIPEPLERAPIKWNATRAGLLRVVLALQGAVSVPFVAALQPYLWVFVANVGVALLFQLLIWRGYRHVALALMMGTVDLLFATFLVHINGSTQSLLCFLYLLIPIVFATTTSRRRVSMTLAIAGVSFYAAVLSLEWFDVLSFAPAMPVRQDKPEAAIFVFSVLFMAVTVLTTTRFLSQLIAALGNANRKLKEQSQRDELTGLYNRRYMHQRLNAELARVQRGGRLTLLMVDLDGFKRVNDAEGHDAGDKVLQALAEALLKATRRSDIVARYGGDEFVVLLPDTSIEGCEAVAARIVDHARDVGRKTYPAIPVTASVGLAAASQQEDEASLLRRADEGVYAAKRSGGDRVASV